MNQRRLITRASTFFLPLLMLIGAHAAIADGVFEVEPSATSAEQTKNFTYSFCIENSNSLTATVTIQSDIPTGTAFVSASSANSVTPSTVTWSIYNVPAGGPRQCVDLVVNVQAAIGSSLENNATIQSDQPFTPAAITTTTPVIAPTPTSGGGLSSGGAFGLLELCAALLALTGVRVFRHS